MESAECPRCGSPRVDAPDCPRCGVVYAKAKTRPRAEPDAPALDLPSVAPPHLAEPGPVWDAAGEEATFERRVRQLALPLALAVAFVTTASGFFRMLSRLFFSMWLHELGHAFAAWLSGFAAFPGPWRTSVSDTRSAVVSLLLAVGLARLAQLGFRARRFGWVALAGSGLFVQLLCTLVAGESAARAFVTFSGDGGAFVLASLLMITLYARPGSWLHRGAIRWGCLVIGAFAFADVFRTWWSARQDWAAIPFGANEGVGLSDSSKLVDVHGWSEKALVNAYVALGGACLVLLALAYGLGWTRWSERQRAD